MVAAILAHRTHPETGRRACLGLMRLAERHGASRLEAACGRAIAIGNPRYKTVEAILKSGLDKVALREEVEAKTVFHENIRGGAYFDREETEMSASADGIEARYLEEDRFAITNEPEVAPRPREPRSGGGDGVAVAPRSAAEPAPPSVVMQPLPALLERLQALWTRSPAARDRGDADSRVGQPMALSCTSPSTCIAEEPSGGEDMNNVVTCKPEDDWAESQGASQGEV
ncbi:hypothetical protein [Sorangium sp. So ce1151]|uniref:hypothetical protein n=1 Tax=Sorangium sp. So ce1151 TaxID=3133332 RepID=UPI003F640E49